MRPGEVQVTLTFTTSEAHARRILGEEIMDEEGQSELLTTGKATDLVMNRTVSDFVSVRLAS